LYFHYKQFAPVPWVPQQELSGIRKAEGQPKNKLAYFSVCPATFRCAHAHSRRGFAALPESGGRHFCRLFASAAFTAANAGFLLLF